MNGTIQNRPGPCIAWNLPSRSTTARSHCLAIFGDCVSDDAREEADDGGERAAQDVRYQHPDRHEGHEDEKRDDVHSSSFLFTSSIDAPSAPR